MRSDASACHHNAYGADDKDQAGGLAHGNRFAEDGDAEEDGGNRLQPMLGVELL